MRRRLHIRCGSDIKDALQIAEIPGDFAAFGDPICEGPCPGNLSQASYLQARAAFMHAHWDLDPTETLARFERDVALVKSAHEYDELTLWFEHDLFDQCILIQILAQLPQTVLGKTSLICIGDFPGVQRFIGLGQLSPEQLRSLLPVQRPITSQDQAIAKRALQAWLAPDPSDLLALTRPDCCASLTFLPKAIERHLQELPSKSNGLGRTDQIILESIQAGATCAIEVFAAYQSQDPAPYLGDLMFWAHLHQLASPPHPLIEIQGEFPIETTAITPAGLAVLTGQTHYMQLHPCPLGSLYRWRGGIEQDPDRGWVYAWDHQGATVCKYHLT